MRALVAEENKIERIKLSRALKRLELDVEEVADELGAICVIYQPDPPDIALLGLDTVLIDFAQICTSMRSSKPDIKIVALVPADQKHRLVEIIEAGASDFIVKPSTTQEIEARLRIVLNRSPEQTNDVEEDDVEVDEADVSLPPALEALLREPVELLVQPPAPKPPEEPPASEPSVPEEPEQPADGITQIVFEQIAYDRVMNMAARALRLQPVEEVHPLEAVQTAYLSGWASFALTAPNGGYWLDIRLDVSESDLRQMTQTKRRPMHANQMSAYLQEVMVLLQDAIQRQFRGIAGLTVYQPYDPFTVNTLHIPKDLYSAKAGRKQWGFRLKQTWGLRLSITVDTARQETRRITEMRQMDVLAGPIQSTTGDVVLLRAGVMLDRSYISKLQTLALTFRLAPHVPIFRPPSGVAVFLDKQNVVG